MSGRASLVATIWRGELLRLVRDRRAFLMAVVLPVVLFPAFFVLMPKLSGMAQESLDEEETTVWIALEHLDAPLAARVRTALEEVEEPLVVREEPDFRGQPWATLLDEEFGSELDPEEFEEGCDAVLLARPEGDRLDLVVHGSRTRSSEARRRVRDALEELVEDDRTAGLLATLDVDPGARLALEEVDLAPPDDALGLRVGRLLPLLAVFLILSAGSFAALDAFAGERESGTLETLLVQPVPSLQLAWGKFLCVATIASIAFAANAAGLFACAALGLGEFEGAAGAVPPVRILTALVVYAPTLLLFSAILTWLSARARSFREGQNLLLPVMLGALAPASLATQDSVTLDLLLGALPIAGASLAMRDALSGALGWGLGAWVVVWSTGFALLSLRSVAKALDAERVLTARAPGAESDRDVRFRRALAWGFTAVLLVYVVGGRLQSWRLAQGLAATLWLLAPTIAVAIALDLRRRTGEGVAATLLGPRRPHVAHLAGGVLCAPFLLFCAGRWVAWQQEWLPLPEASLAGMLEPLSPTWRLVLFAASPAIFEELLFRGAILRAMGRVRWRRAILWQAILFALVHASVHRFVATGVLGGVTAAMALASGSILPAVLFHGTYNGLIVGESLVEGGLLDEAWWPAAAGAFVLGAALFTVGRRASGTPREAAAAESPGASG